MSPRFTVPPDTMTSDTAPLCVSNLKGAQASGDDNGKSNREGRGKVAGGVVVVGKWLGVCMLGGIRLWNVMCN